MKKLIFTLLLSLISYTHNVYAIPNPAAVNCTKVGGKSSIEKLPSGDSIGICTFDTNHECEQWALFRKHCPIGGIKTHSLTKEERYCLILGGNIINKTNCTLPAEKICSLHSLYNNIC